MGRYAAALAITVLALGAGGCGKRAAGGCREDVDCPPGYDCRSGACTHRERMKFTGAGGVTVAPPVEEAAPPAPPPRPVDAPPSPPATPALVRPKPRTTPVPAPEAPPALPTPPVPEQRLPAWKQRLKNT